MKTIHPGDQLDHYRIESLIARSGMASIYRATDLNTGRTVAIKIPHPEMEADPVLFDRFHREEEIGKKMDHPGVMKVLTDEDRSQVYMVMEWVDGRLLRKIISENGKLPPERAIKIAVGILDALDYIHSHGVVHRDLKPENIMVDDRGPHQAHRLRHRGAGGSAAADLRQAVTSDGYARLHFSGTGQRETRRRAQRYLRAGRDAVRNAHRQDALSRT